MTRVINWTYSAWLLILGPLVFVFAIGPWIDRQFPVVDPFVIEQAHCKDYQCTIFSGWMEKRRNCKFLDVYTRVNYGAGEPSLIQEISMLDRKDPGRTLTRPTGSQLWGPWYVKVPPGAVSVEFISHHQCHPFWETQSILTLYEVPRVP